MHPFTHAQAKFEAERQALEMASCLFNPPNPPAPAPEGKGQVSCGWPMVAREPDTWFCIRAARPPHERPSKLCGAERIARRMRV